MSDAHRKDLHDKVGETLTPDATKTTSQKVQEAVTDTADRTARETQPDSSKSTTQETVDKIEHAKDNTAHGGTHQTVGEKIKDALHLGKHDKTSDNTSTNI